VKFSIEWYIIVEVLLDLKRHFFYQNQDRSMFPWESIGNNDIFCYNSGRARPIILIFELDRDIGKTILCTKFHQDRSIFSRVIVLTAGRPDILTDSRVYSLFEYTKTVPVYTR
jgi:hypothetical protein